MRNEIRSLTGLRGIAALLVAVFHFQIGIDQTFGEFIRHGYLWVDLFFVLSGFVMAKTYAHLLAAGFTMAAYWAFLSRRIARVYPLYFIMILVHYALLATNLLPDTKFTNIHLALAADLLAVQALVQQQSLDWQSWSISTEMLAYLAFPILAALALFSRRWVAVTVGVAAYLGLGGLVLAHMRYHVRGIDAGALDITNTATFAPILRCVGEFTLGLLTWRAVQDGRVLASLERDAVCWSLVALLVLLMSIRNSDLLLVPVFVLLIIALSGDKPAVARVLGAPAVHVLGLWSYALYLAHDLVMPIRLSLSQYLISAGVPAPLLVTVLVMCAVAIGLAGILYHVIEMPSRVLMRRLLDPAPPARQRLAPPEGQPVAPTLGSEGPSA